MLSRVAFMFFLLSPYITCARFISLIYRNNIENALENSVTKTDTVYHRSLNKI